MPMSWPHPIPQPGSLGGGEGGGERGLVFCFFKAPVKPSLRATGEAKRRNLGIRRPEAQTTTESSCDLGQVSYSSGLVFSSVNWEFQIGKPKLPKTHSTSLAFPETSLGLPRLGRVLGTWLGSAFLLTGEGKTAHPSAFPVLPSTTWPSALPFRRSPASGSS